jgi:hypothetical protein
MARFEDGRVVLTTREETEAAYANSLRDEDLNRHIEPKW